MQIPHLFKNREDLYQSLSRTASHAWTTLTRLTHKIWHKAQTWRGIEESPRLDDSVFSQRILATAQRYGLEDYFDPKDPTHKVYLSFAQTHNHSQDPLHEKTILTGLAHHFLTTLERTSGTLDEGRLAETYHTASRMAELFQKHQEYHTEPLEMVHALRQANKMKGQEKENLEKQSLFQDSNPLTHLKTEILHQETQNQHLQQIHTHHISHPPTLGG